ncbi:uncharacterized protein LOC111715216 [Eurytemora carolleeae]|uniref:uncharacterized protein LOC111715216 n=1 Tax=Eurytemora carolleeae TaxID=1294199 RepID=UPI000C77E0E0|nr:uncharacterized protein LOC111715216 [Eurytemora carolleeae]|eukprot:XP_023346287.1 uncharacterized protein LOC111715216 [Eurytemora affinis]
MFPNGTILYNNGTVDSAVVHWGVLDPRNPRAISNLRNFLGDIVGEHEDIDLDTLIQLDNKRIQRTISNPGDTDSSQASRILPVDPRFALAEFSAKASRMLAKYSNSTSLLETCATQIFCKSKSFLPDLRGFSFVKSFGESCNKTSESCF